MVASVGRISLWCLPLKGHLVETRNCFLVLEGVAWEEIDLARGDEEKNEGAGSVPVPQGRVLVLEDIQV